jgi:hypothetical protein
MPATAGPAPARQMTGTIDISNFEDDFAVRMGLLPPQDRLDFLDRRGAFKAMALELMDGEPNTSATSASCGSTHRLPPVSENKIAQHHGFMIYHEIVSTY